MTHKKPRRWLQSAVTEASKCEVAMPWQRGAVRAEALARRADAANPKATGPRAEPRRA